MKVYRVVKKSAPDTGVGFDSEEAANKYLNRMDDKSDYKIVPGEKSEQDQLLSLTVKFNSCSESFRSKFVESLFSAVNKDA